MKSCACLFALLVVASTAAPVEDKLSSFFDLQEADTSFASVRDAELSNIRNPQGMGSMSKGDWVEVQQQYAAELTKSGPGHHFLATPEHLPHFKKWASVKEQK